MPDSYIPSGVHLVGSIPFANADDVFRTTSEMLPGHLARVTDGETGARQSWVGAQFPILLAAPQLEKTSSDPDEYGPPVAAKLREGADVSEIKLPELGYAKEAKASYEKFKELKAAGTIPAHWRFQVSLPTPLATIIVLVVAEDRTALEPIYTAAMEAELDEIVKSIPAEELTIQWDVCQEVGLWEGFYKDHMGGKASDRVTAELAGLTKRIPEPIELGVHLCYGDYDHQHFMQPKDMGVLVEMANEIIGALPRSLNYIHFPVPQDRTDDEYFAPLTGLKLPTETKLYIGLVHIGDGVEGAKARIAAAHKFAPDFGISTECGMGRRPTEQVKELLGIHRDVSAAIT